MGKIGKRRLHVGQVWCAVHRTISSSETLTGYRFELVYESVFMDESDKTWKPFWLGVKLIDLDPHDDHPQCWWFDEYGFATIQDDEMFMLTRKPRKH